MLRAVLFDLDGTLIDHDAARAAGLVGYAAEQLSLTQQQELERLDREWGRLEELHYEQYTSGACSYAEHRRRRMRGLHAALGREQLSDEQADAHFAGYLDHYRASWCAFEDAAPALAALASADPRVALGIVTNGEGESQRAKLAAIGLAEHFPLVVASGELGIAKPDPAIFAHACEQLGVGPAQAAHVGDRLDLDARAAAAAGLRGIWLDRAATAPPPDGLTTIATLAELPAVLNG